MTNEQIFTDQRREEDRQQRSGGATEDWSTEKRFGDEHFILQQSRQIISMTRGII
jgi:hypothetical protein